jgi:hypothetical protein
MSPVYLGESSLLTHISHKLMIRIQAPTTAPLAAPIPWRKQGIRHSNNEIYFDIAESMDAIVDK